MAKFRKGIRIALKTLAVIIAILALLTLIFANSSFVQNKLVDIATNALSKQLNTDVGIDHIGLNLLNMSASIEGIRLKGQQQRGIKQVFSQEKTSPCPSLWTRGGKQNRLISA